MCPHVCVQVCASVYVVDPIDKYAYSPQNVIKTQAITDYMYTILMFSWRQTASRSNCLLLFI